MDQHEDIWLVQLGNGAIRAMTLDELDAAYQEGAIDEDTYVRRDGSSKWSRLRDEIGAAEPPPPAPPPAASYGAVPAYPAQPYQAQVYQAPQQPLYSTRPVVSELDLDEVDLGSPFKKSRKGTYAAVAAVAAAAIATAVFGASRMNAPAASVNASVVNATQPPAVVTPPPPVAAPASTLSEEQKKALSDLDKQHQKTWAEQRIERMRRSAPHRHYKSHNPFRKGGSKYDPLNAKL
jgi:hypothetical protein